MVRKLAFAFVLVATPACATEIDFATKLVDLDGVVYKDCARLVGPQPNQVCAEWVEHTLGLIAYSALDKVESSANFLEQARRAVLARKVYPGKEERHVVDLSASEITLIVDLISKLQIRPVELLKCVELLDPARLKDVQK